MCACVRTCVRVCECVSRVQTSGSGDSGYREAAEQHRLCGWSLTFHKRGWNILSTLKKKDCEQRRYDTKQKLIYANTWNTYSILQTLKFTLLPKVTLGMCFSRKLFFFWNKKSIFLNAQLCRFPHICTFVPLEPCSSVTFEQSGLMNKLGSSCLWTHKHMLIFSFLVCCLHYVVIVHHHGDTSCYWFKEEQDLKTQCSAGAQSELYLGS